MTRKQANYRMADMAVAVVVTLAVAVGIYYAAHSYILDRAESTIQHLLLSQRSLHHYIQRVMHPAFFKGVENGSIAKNYYTPEVFSSSYVVRTMHGFYNEELAKHGRDKIIYRLAAENPRNPVNQADARELGLIQRFNDNRNLAAQRDIIELGGKKYLHYAIPFLENTAKCLRCHGKRENAPPGLLTLYPGNGGFNEKAGRIRAIESIYAPLHKEYEALSIIIAVVAAILLTMLGIVLLNNRLRALVAHKTKNLQDELQARREAENQLYLQTVLLKEEIAERQAVQETLVFAKKQAEAANLAKSAFLANMSHELRTPLNGVIGMAQLLSFMEVTAKQKEYLEDLQSSADNLLVLINDILELSRIESEQIELNTLEFDPHDSIIEVAMLHQAQIGAKKLNLKMTIHDAVPDKLIGDQLRIKQVLSHLLSNAIKFTEYGGITISVCVRERYESSILLEISVSDTGIGIEPEKLLYIFGRFTQADESFTRQYGGLGVGLAISRKLTELMGGCLSAESDVTKGSTFRLLLPCTVQFSPDPVETLYEEASPPS